jgi:putative heme-binding domain-containing protein
VNAKLLSPADLTVLAGAALGTNTLEAVGFMLDDVLPAKLDEATLANAVHFIARNGKERAVRMAIEFGQARADFRQEVEMFLAFHEGTQERGTALQPKAQEWAETLTTTLLASKDVGRRLIGAEIVRVIRLASKEPALLALAADVDAGDAPRAAALGALAALDGRKHAATIGATVRDGRAPAPLRDRAARVLGTLNLREARGELVESFPTASGPLAAAIAAALVNTPAGCEELLGAIAAGKASPRLLQDRVIQTRMRDARIAKLDERLAKLTAGLPAFDQKIGEVLKKRAESFARAKPDAGNGLKVYEKHCAACHQLAGKGQKVGPQLDGIGARGAEKLIEDILDPNRNVDPNFRTTRLTLKNGMELTGLLLREEGEVAVLADNMGKEVRVEKRLIEEKTISPLSPMPANWAEQIPEKDFADLLAYLLGQRGR